MWLKVGSFGIERPVMYASLILGNPPSYRLKTPFRTGSKVVCNDIGPPSFVLLGNGVPAIPIPSLALCKVGLTEEVTQLQ